MELFEYGDAWSWITTLASKQITSQPVSHRKTEAVSIRQRAFDLVRYPLTPRVFRGASSRLSELSRCSSRIKVCRELSLQLEAICELLIYVPPQRGSWRSVQLMSPEESQKDPIRARYFYREKIRWFGLYSRLTFCLPGHFVFAKASELSRKFSEGTFSRSVL